MNQTYARSSAPRLNYTRSIALLGCRFTLSQRGTETRQSRELSLFHHRGFAVLMHSPLTQLNQESIIPSPSATSRLTTPVKYSSPGPYPVSQSTILANTLLTMQSSRMFSARANCRTSTFRAVQDSVVSSIRSAQVTAMQSGNAAGKSRHPWRHNISARPRSTRRVARGCWANINYGHASDLLQGNLIAFARCDSELKRNARAMAPSRWRGKKVFLNGGR